MLHEHHKSLCHEQCQGISCHLNWDTLVCRERRINDAVRFAQETLSPLRGIMAHRSSEYDAMLHDTVALIAYEEPEVGRTHARPAPLHFQHLAVM